MNSLNSGNVDYIEDLYLQWQQDPQSVPQEWNQYFRATVSQDDLSLLPQDAEQVTYKQSRVYSLVWAYREVGYISANLNPLGEYRTPELEYMYLTMKGVYQNLELEDFKLTQEDLNKTFYYGRDTDHPPKPLREIIAELKATYCSTIGFEFLHIQNKVMRNWLIRRIEKDQSQWPNEEKIQFQKDLIRAEEFENFIQSSFIGQKRFSLEGGEALVPALHYLFWASMAQNIQEIVLGMAHRGRLNIFTNAMQKPASELFGMFLHHYHPHSYGGTGDVKYHLGQSFDFVDEQTGRSLHIGLVPNPSHLESVDPVVEGKARAIQRKHGDINRKKVLPVLIHGDAAFSGQGVVAETFNLSQLKGYRTGGTIHIIINNQIGFTTASRDARSTFFATDIAKTLPVPIFHVNGDDPEAVVRGMDLALAWRHKFGYDVVLDIICYRKMGHNEADEPSFTHPRMYTLIQNHPSVTTLYGQKLDQDQVFSKAAQEEFRERYLAELKAELDKSKEMEDVPANDGFQQGEWRNFQAEYSFDIPETHISEEDVQKIGKVLTSLPEDFAVHPKLQRIIDTRKKILKQGEGFDWGFAESLGFGSLLLEGHHIRLSGEDCGRGTFSHRHAVWWDVETLQPRSYIPLNAMTEEQTKIAIHDSPLSEFSVLGFEYGYSTSLPNVLTIWEGQFGDFVNGAQVIIDQYIVSGETKWFRASGLVMLLPHGMEGQGPEHSHGYLERFLQLCAEENIQVCNLTTPAQYFHVLRKQVKQSFRKPLIIMAPKSLLRHKLAVSALSDFTEGQFRMVIDDAGAPKNIKRLLLCSGKVYYDLLARREEQQNEDTAIIRIEQLYPFPKNHLKSILQQYEQAVEVFWVQEETKNRGAWTFIRDQFLDFYDITIAYIGRSASASPATGSYSEHTEELENILRKALPG